MIYLFYYIFLLKYFSATLGGRILGVFHVQKNGEKLSRIKAAAKSFVMYIFLSIAMISYYSIFPLSNKIIIVPALLIISSIYVVISLPMFFNVNKRSLIDFISGTKVVYNNKYFIGEDHN